MSVLCYDSDICSRPRHCLFFKEMTLNKMVWNFWHQFLIRFSMLFQMVPFILLCMVAHLTITWLVETIPTANQRALCWWFLKLPWREKRKVPSERAMKIESETGVKSDTPFCSWLPIKITNSACYYHFKLQKFKDISGFNSRELQERPAKVAVLLQKSLVEPSVCCNCEHFGACPWHPNLWISHVLDPWRQRTMISVVTQSRLDF